MKNIQNIDYSKIINYLSLLYAFALPLSRAGISIITALLFIFWLLEGDLKNKLSQLKLNKVILAFVVFIVFNIFSLVYSDNPIEGIKYIARYWYLLAAIVLFTSLKKEFIYKTISVFIFAMFISELLSYGIFFELIEMKHGTPSDPTPFMHHIIYSIFLSFTSILILDRVVYTKELKYKLIYIFFFLSVTANLFITGGRTGQLAFFITIFILFIFRFENKIKAISAASVISILVFVVAITFSNTFNVKVNQTIKSINIITSSQNYCTSIGMRAGAIVLATNIVSNNPLLGVGIIDNIDTLRELIDKKYISMKCMRWYRHYHNQYLEILTAIGLVGLIIFLSIFYNIIRIKYINDEFTIIKIALVSIFLIGFIAEPLLHKQFTLALFSLFTGILGAQNRIENEAKSYR